MSLASLLDRLRGRPIERDLAGYRVVLARVADLEPAMEKLDDAGLTQAARTLRSRVQGGAEREVEQAEAFALAREAARRALGQRPFDEQVLAGLAIAQGKVAEMATGEGKTLAGVAPVFPTPSPAEGRTSSPSTTTWPGATRRGWAPSTSGWACRWVSCRSG